MEKLKIMPRKTQESQSYQSEPPHGEKSICDKHGEYDTYEVSIFSGKKYKQKCPVCSEEAFIERERKNKQIEFDELRKTYFRGCNIPKRFRGLDINSIDLSYHKENKDNERLQNTVSTIKKYIETYPDRLEKGASGFLAGACGTGKTMLACMMVEAIINQGYEAHYTTAWQMIQDIRLGYKNNEGVTHYINSFIRKSFLVIDEIGVQHGTDDERILLYQVIDGRYNEIKPTILISNSMNPVNDGYLDLRTIDRLKEGGGFSIVFKGDSFRK